MTIRATPFSDAELPRLQAALAGWIREAGGCGYYHVGNLPHWIYEVLRGRRPAGDSVQIWEDAAGVGGIVIVGLFGTTFQVFARPDWRGGERELGLLQAAYGATLGQLREAGAAEPTVTTDVFSCDEIRRGLLARLGFEQFRLWDYITERDLSAPIPAAGLPAGFTIRGATPGDYAQLALVRNSAFASGWTPELYRDQVMGKAAYEPGRELLVVAPDGRVAALTVIRLDPLNRIGQFEPVATHGDFRRLGLARALMIYALGEMRRLGMETATVAYDATNLPAGALYQSVGFGKVYETLGYARAGRRA